MKWELGPSQDLPSFSRVSGMHSRSSEETGEVPEMEVLVANLSSFPRVSEGESK